MGELVQIVTYDPKFILVKVAKNRHKIYTGCPFDIDYTPILDIGFSLTCLSPMLCAHSNFLVVSWVCLRFVIVVFLYHTHLLFFIHP